MPPQIRSFVHRRTIKGQVLTVCLEDDPLLLPDALRQAEGIFLGVENSMIDTKRIDEFEGGMVGPQSVNLRKRTGNEYVLEQVSFMRGVPATFFPGTLLRSYEGFSLPVMPVIDQGEILDERAKRTGIAYVDDYRALAAALIDEEFAKSVPTTLTAQRTPEMNQLETALKDRVAAIRGQPRSYDIQGWRVLPVICNEVRTIPNEYGGEPVDLILHSSSNLFPNQEEALKAHDGFIALMGDRIQHPAFIVHAHKGEDSPSFSDITIYTSQKGEIYHGD